MNKIIIAILCITVLEFTALVLGFNGNILSISVAAIAGLAGLATKRPKMLKMA